MARPATGTILTLTLADGTRKFRLRFPAHGQRQDLVLHERPGCKCGCGGGWSEPTARTELGDILARVRAGVWQGPQPPAESAAPEEPPTFHEYASAWLQRKADGVSGDRPLSSSTLAHYRTALVKHLLPHLAGTRINQVDRSACLAVKASMIREASELREAMQAGADLRDKRNRRLVAPSAAQIRKVIGVLAMILDEALEDELIAQNPARGKRMRIRVPKPARSFLELDELAALIDAAAAQDALPQIPAEAMAGEGTRAKVARRLAAGGRADAIAAELGLANATVAYHGARLGGSDGGVYVGRRAVIEILGRSGVRASELCDVRLRDVRLHDPDGARLHIRS
jgi:integrase